METVLSLLKDELAKKHRSAKCQFGTNYKLVNLLGAGQQGIVVLAKNSNGKNLAIKFYAPDDKDKYNTKKGRDRFEKEAQFLINLNHKNIVSLYEYGSAKWDKTLSKWTVTNDFNRPGKILYYVMDFISGKSLKSLFYKYVDNKLVIDEKKIDANSIELFEKLVIQMSQAISFFHSKNITHRDIKPDNIYYSEQDKTFVIVDFGFAKDLKKAKYAEPNSFIYKKEYIDLESEGLGIVDEKFDQFAFASMLLEILEGLHDLYKPYYYEGIKATLLSATSKRTKRFKDMMAFLKQIEVFLYSHPYGSFTHQANNFLVPSEKFGYFDGKIRIPFSGSIPTFKELLLIIDSTYFQRLRGITQLGPTSFVYPGATHTRFEHSLGVYYLSLRYLEVLVKNARFCETAKPIDEAIKVVVLAALLHDIGHYPYSHWIEEINSGLPVKLQFISHESRAEQIILSKELQSIIQKDWGIDPNVVCRLIKKLDGSQSPREQLLKSIIDSVIDIDKIDYLHRDSGHCGVSYGFASDLSRLISSLTVNETADKICLTEKGRSAFSSMLMSKISMYHEIYWHKTVRACTAMFKRYFYEYVLINSKNIKNIRDILLYKGDRAFLEDLFSDNQPNHINELIKPFLNKGRQIYKPAIICYPSHKQQPGNTAVYSFFEKIIAESNNYEFIYKLSLKLVKNLKAYIPQIRSIDILLECTPTKAHEKPSLSGFQFYDPRSEVYENINNEISQMNEYLESNRRAFIYCAPKYYAKIKELSMSDQGIDNSILGKILTKL